MHILRGKWHRYNNWPSQLPDVNLIEDMWAVMRFKLREKKIYNLVALSPNTRNIETIPENLAESMSLRCQYGLTEEFGQHIK